MLILTRKPGERIYIGDQIKITIVEIKGNQIRIGIDAPNSTRIYREEIYLQILEENKLAAEGGVEQIGGLDSLADQMGGNLGNQLPVSSAPRPSMLKASPVLNKTQHAAVTSNNRSTNVIMKRHKKRGSHE